MNILIIQILRLGDALQLTPVIQSLKHASQNANISVLTSSLGAEILSPQKAVDRVYEVRIENLVRLTKNSELTDLLSAIDMLEADLTPVLNQKWDWVINFNYSFPSALIAHLVEGSYCSGFYATSKRQYFAKEKWFAYGISAFVNRKHSAYNWVDINKNILNLSSIPPGTIFPVKEENKKEIDSYLEKIKFSGEKILGIAPGASNDFKKWPVEKFTELVRNLINKYNYKILVLGDEKDKASGLNIKAGTGSGCEDLTGKTSIPELAGFLSKCELLISNDSGPMHMANAVGTPVVSLFFSTHFVETGPYGPNNFVVFPDIPCFPCQGTVKCTHKECLSYIQPATIEKLICQRDQLLKNNNRLTLSDSDGPVAVNRSLFDTWGNLDWLPLNKRSLELKDIMRIIFKVFWQSSLNDDNEGTLDDTIRNYIAESLNCYEPPENNNDLGAFFHRLQAEFESIGHMYHESHRLSMEIYNALLKGNNRTVSELGETLQHKEDEISALVDNTYSAPLADYINFRLDNMVEQTMTNLAIKTALSYREAEQLASKLKSGSEWVSKVITHIV